MQKANPKSAIAPKVHALSPGMIHCPLRYSTDAAHIKFTVEIQSAGPEASQRDVLFSSLLAQLQGLSSGPGPASGCRPPEGIRSSPRQEGFKRTAH